ncbi:DUF6282 family protein [Methylobacterium sp. NEAU 140]|uniref:DUF6282 family protein n=1 Tax=Methylobacterium sp. NEAU 140 TaxID=3064945 RepID=UPI0027358285|nr:DUF6282 family protein [Methylobacterium sp. NEAU 140]MDP4026569.1 DUF6282 family protein [Methylobacterium sp. NEAU 140]
MTDDELSERLLASGVVDTHYHIGPELLDRRYDVASLADAARRWNFALVLKNHTYPTTPLAALARAKLGVRFYGSVVLNRFVGGLNPDAVYGAASGNRTVVDAHVADPPFVVYMPTVHAAAHLRVLGHAFDARWSCGHAMDNLTDREGEAVSVYDADLHPAPGLADVLRAIAETGAILATGHLSADEIMALVPMALESGVRRVLLTHPHYPSVELSDEQLCRLASDPRVFIEHCLAIHTIEEVPLSRFAESIRATGTQQVVLATDFGQIHSDPLPDGTLKFAKELHDLLKNEIDTADFIDMFSGNGRRALDSALTSEQSE